jgi:hypothetical protein
MTLHRMRQGVAGKFSAQEYQNKKAQLEELKRLDNEKKLIYLTWMKQEFVDSLVYPMAGRISENI